MNTYHSLLITFGKPHVRLEDIAKDYLPPMTEKTLKQRASLQQLSFPVFRAGSNKSPWLVDLRDLAEYLDAQREEAIRQHEAMAGASS